MDQVLPFQLSASASSGPGLLPYKPTALHADDDGQLIASRSLNPAVLGLGVDWIAQLLPFQRSASVRPPAEVLYHPTASQCVAEEQATLFSVLPVAPVGLGAESIAQAVPFHRSARARNGP